MLIVLAVSSRTRNACAHSPARLPHCLSRVALRHIHLHLIRLLQKPQPMAALVEKEYGALQHGTTEIRRYEIGRRSYQSNGPKQQARGLHAQSEGEEKVMSYNQELVFKGLA